MQVGKTKDQGLYNKPSAAVHPGALAAGNLPQYNTSELQEVIIVIMVYYYIFMHNLSTICLRLVISVLQLSGIHKPRFYSVEIF